MVKTDLINYYKKCDISGYTVLLPSIGVGNVAQLSIDLLISSLKMEKIATVWHRSIVPIIGPKAFQHDTDKITTSCELYISYAKKIVAFQIRSPIVAATMMEFFNELIDILKLERVEKLVLLTSSYAYEQHFVGTNPFAMIANDAFKNAEKNAIRRWSEYQGDIIHGGGYAKQLMSVASDKSIPCLILFKYVSEGDNSGDAVSLLEELNYSFDFMEKSDDGKLNVILPISWKSLFGNPLPDQLY
ncbi:Proteasome assembly chaperone 2 [Pseudolycoriella hygida]|uniref:Proteasome assembly chaperone 2 n=1 Tax=Pseudolycoriella hygida TaxID=35572 RepID=A0A9Q0MPE2_9DIPT|nr:Proteasome assembly chaperone 2 [Pseudolycoriella hygida]